VRTTARALLATVARWSVLAVGVALVALSFVNLVEVHNQAALASPWWWLGLIGIAATGLALGAPRPPRCRRDAGS
jgi:Na+-transporting NADH:ubiquinone oxidoreductase subunit NqrB